MDELKLLIEMVANLPAMAMWVLVGFFVYKVVVIGSIYGVIRYVTAMFVQWKTAPKVVAYKCGAEAISEEVNAALSIQIQRFIKGPYNYLHMAEVMKLKAAIDEMERTAKQKELK